MTYILGINAFHGDSSACIIKDGKLIAAVEEERFNRVKHWAGFPVESIKYCLSSANIPIGDLDYISVNSDPKSNLLRKLAYAAKNRPELGFLIDRVKNQKERVGIVDRINGIFSNESFKGSFRQVEHHLAHLSSAYYVSPYDEACVLSVDGFGDFASTAWGIGRGSSIEIDDKVYYPYSLGSFYQALTQYIGFPNYGDEYKVMGLAPYGSPIYMDEMRKIVKLKADGSFSLEMKYFIYDKEKVEYEWEGGSPKVGRLYSDSLEELFGPARLPGEELTQKHKDIARSIQGMYEESFFHLLNQLHAKYKVDNLCLAGGCAMNSVANGKVKLNTPFKNVYIQSAAGDAGGAIGAAFCVWAELSGRAIPFVMDHAYFGPEYSEAELISTIEKRTSEIEQAGCKTINHAGKEDELLSFVAQSISKGLVIGWYQGRLEWGPRALGNRSILGDPRRDDMKDILNLKIKRRESFRPFAPSVLRESVNDWFEQDDDVPFMMKVLQIKLEKRELIPAVTHADGSGRLQTVYERTNPKYYRLISKFYDLTGVPMLLNTSFNENEPVVCKPEEALDCFLRTNMDILVMGDLVIERRSATDGFYPIFTDGLKTT